MTSKHTPGPWSCTHYECPDQWAIYEGSGGNQLAIVYDKANAALIAAAPETAAEQDRLRRQNRSLTRAIDRYDGERGSLKAELDKLREELDFYKDFRLHDDRIITERSQEIDSLKAVNAELVAVLSDWFDTPGNRRDATWWHEWERKSHAILAKVKEQYP